MKTYKTRHQFYLPDNLSEKLEQLSSRPGASKTAVLTEALKAWIDRRGAHELDARFGHRLDRFSREHEAIHRRLDFIAEALGVFVHHQLTLVAHQPPFDEETRRLGRERYQMFLQITGQMLAQSDTRLKIAPRKPVDE